MKTLILGIGNEIRRDDAVGLIVARKVFKQINSDNLDVKVASSGGLPLLGKIEGYDKIYLIDSIMTKDGTPGDWYSLSLDDFERGKNRMASHSIDLKTMKEIGEDMGEKIGEIQIFAIEVKEPFEFGEELTEEVKEALPQIVSEIKETIESEAQKSKD